MAGINAGPSMGFMGRMKQMLPGAINAAGSMMPGPFGQTSRITGGMMKRRPKDGATNQPPQQEMPPTTNPVDTGGIVRMPNLPIFGNPNMGGFFPPGRNTGITGGMFPPSGPIIRPQPMPETIGGRPGLWNIYSNLADETGIPNRQMFY